MTNQGAMPDQWTRPRECVACGKPYSLAGHGTVSAKAALQGIAQGLDPAVLGAEMSKCPACLGARRLSEQEAVAAALAIGAQVRRGHDEETYRYARRFGLFAAAMGLLSFIIVYSYARLRGAAFSPLPWYFLSGTLAVAGIATFAWANKPARRS